MLRQVLAHPFEQVRRRVVHRSNAAEIKKNVLPPDRIGVELAQHLVGRSEKEIVLQLNEESLVAALGEANQQPFACLNLDTVGRLGDGKLLVLGADSARELRFVFMGVGYTTGAPISIVTEPLDASDQGSCHDAGIPGVQLFTGPHVP